MVIALPLRLLSSTNAKTKNSTSIGAWLKRPFRLEAAVYLGKNESGEYILDPDEQPATDEELDRAKMLFDYWSEKLNVDKSRKCPHWDEPCPKPGGARCLRFIVWWMRYWRELEGVVN